MKYKIYKKNIIGALEALQNYNFQRVSWFPNDKGLTYSFNENIMDLFYDSSLDDALKAGEVVFGKEADITLLELEKESRKIDDTNYRTEILINLPEMQTIREKAAKALELVLASDGSESTVEIVE